MELLKERISAYLTGFYPLIVHEPETLTTF